MVNNKNVFWQALVFTIIIFLFGVMIGFFLESNRSEKVERVLLNSEINLLDEQIRGRSIDDFEVDCSLATNSTFEYADKIYSEAVNLEEYDSASKFRDSMKILHKRYDLLRMILWSESMNLRERCNNDFHTVVYFYSYQSEDVDLRAKQLFYSRLLADLKSEHPDEVLLIPIAADMDLASVNLVMEKYGIENIPSILIDEKTIIEDIITLEDLEKKAFG